MKRVVSSADTGESLKLAPEERKELDSRSKHFHGPANRLNRYHDVSYFY